MTATSSAGTDLSREILGKVLDERGKPGSDVQDPEISRQVTGHCVTKRGLVIAEINDHQDYAHIGL